VWLAVRVLSGTLLIPGMHAMGQAVPRSAAPSAPAGAGQVPACDPAQLSFAIDREGGQFDGMSHSGTLLVLRNLGPGTCSVPGRPVVAFLDANRKTLPVSLRTSPGMHPGPVILPVAVPPGAELTSEARWVSSDAYGANNCVSPRFIALSLGLQTQAGAAGDQRFSAPLETQLCGPAGQHPTYTVTLLRPDPRYAPPAR
jgi:hypothetical protein